MSKIQDVPFITKVIDTLSDELKSGLYDLIDGQVKTPVFRSLVNNDYAITEANDKGKVQFVTLETLRGNYTGYLAYNSVYCVLIAFKGNTQALDMLNINVAKHTFAFVNESLSILELRVELEDGKEGGTITIDETFDETSTNPVQNKAVTKEFNKYKSLLENYAVNIQFENTSANILALTSDNGTGLGTDTGHWYYWNGTQYVDGGVYQATEIPFHSIDIDKIKGTILKNLTYYATQYGVDGRYYYNNNGSISSGGNPTFKAYVFDVEPNTQYTFTTARFLIRCNNNLEPVDTENVANVKTINTNTATKLIISWDVVLFPLDDYIFSKGTVLNNTYTLPDWLINNNKKIKLYNFRYDTLNANTTVDYDNQNSFIEGDRLSASFDIPNGFASFEIGKRRSASNKQLYFVVDNTKITAYNDINDTFELTHGLTITNNLQINIKLNLDKSVDITLVSNGIMYQGNIANVQWQSYRGNNYFICADTITNVSLDYSNEKLDKDIVIFGDSYAQYYQRRWIYYLKNNGYTNNIINAYPGETTQHALKDLENVIKMVNPKYAIWILGMNDTDYDTWLNGVNTFINTCVSNKIEPILATIPSVPTIDNESKNTWVRGSGYRYIDFAKGVGANSSGVWFSGMIHTDNVHPSESGAKALYMRAISDFPELMIGE